MAATGKTPILLYGSTTPTNAPVAGNLTNSSDGCEIAINVADKNLFFKDSTNAVNTVPIRQSSASSNGWLSSTDWSTFNSKQPAGSYALTTGTLAQFASTTSAQLAGVISDETGSGSLVFGTSPTIGTPTITGGTINNTVIGGTTIADGSFAALSAKTAPNTNPLLIYNNSDNLITHNFVIDSSKNAYLYMYAAGQSAKITLNTAGTSSFNAGDLSIGTGNLAIGTSGKGIDFSATAGTGTSELLADYEEGLHTATISLQTSGSVTLSGTGNTLQYVKIGNLVTVSGNLVVSSVSSPTGYMDISLPYTCANLTNVAGESTASLLINGAVSTAVNGFTGWTNEGSAAMRVFLVSGTGISLSSGQQMQANTSIHMSITYRTA